MAKEKSKRTEQTACMNGSEDMASNKADHQSAGMEQAECEACGDVVTISMKELDAVKQEIEKIQASAKEAVEDAQRIQAEFNNYRKRNASIRAESFEDGVRETIKSLLPVIDNFERAIESADDTPFAEGIKKIHRQLLEILEKSGLKQVDASGMFDPNLHEAVLRDEEGELPSGSITAVMQAGYAVKDRIIRHSMVKVRS